MRARTFRSIWQSLAAGAVAAASIFALAGCKYERSQPTEKQTVTGFDLPGFDLNVDPLKDGAPAAEIRYSGSVVLFQPQISAAAIRNLLDASVRTRETKANWIAYRKLAVVPQEQELAAAKAEHDGLDAASRAGPAVTKARHDAAWGWFEARLAAWQQHGSLSPAGDASGAVAREIFSAYCEAKIWELATNAKALGALYTRRPVPLAACENFFTNSGLLAGERCADASGTEVHSGKSYAACLWREGVFKTRFFKAQYEAVIPAEPGVTKAEKLAVWVDDGTLAAVLTGDKGPRAAEAAMTQDRARLSSVFGATYKEIFVPAAGAPAGRADQNLITPDSASPAMLVAAVEDGTLPGAGGTPPRLVLPLSAKEDQAFAADMTAFAGRTAGEPSVNDFLFSNAVPTWPQPGNFSVVQASAKFTALFAAKDPAFEPRLALADERTGRASLGLAATAEEENRLFSAYTAALAEGGAAATAPDVGEGFWINASLVIEPGNFGGAADGTGWRATFKLDDAKAQPAIATDADSAHEAGTGALRIGLTLSKPGQFGFALAAAAPESPGQAFSLLSAAAVDGAEMTVKMWPNQAGSGALAFYSGTILLDTADGAHYEGGINLLGGE